MSASVQLPTFWIADCDAVEQRLARLERGRARILAHSPGGRAIHVVDYGESETVPRRANFNAAVAARELEAFADTALRMKPVVLFVGPVHGHEVEGLVGLVNLIEALESGADYSGAPRERIRELAAECRLLIVPLTNPDGNARFEPRSLVQQDVEAWQRWAFGTWADGSTVGWADSKSLHPRLGQQVGSLGCVMNDIGVDPMLDNFFDPLSVEAPAILRLAKEEAPDVNIVMHSRPHPTGVFRPRYVPPNTSAKIAEIADRFFARLDKLRIPHDPRLWRPEDPNAFGAFDLTCALYHICGAPSLTFCCSHGIASDRDQPVSHEQILEIQFALFEMAMEFAIEQKALNAEEQEADEGDLR